MNSGRLWREPPFCQKLHGLFDKIKSFEKPFLSRMRHMRNEYQTNIGCVESKVALLCNFSQSFTMTYQAEVPAKQVPCATRLSALLVRIARHLPKTISIFHPKRASIGPSIMATSLSPAEGAFASHLCHVAESTPAYYYLILQSILGIHFCLQISAACWILNCARCWYQSSLS